MRLIDADAHVIESEETWKHLDPEFHSRRPIAIAVPEDTSLHDYNTFWLIDHKVRHFGATPTAGNKKAAGKPFPVACQEITDVRARIEAMDRAGVEKQVVHPSFCLSLMTEDPELEAALMRSYNAFMAEKCQESGGRLYFNAVVPFRKPDAAIEEIRRLQGGGGMVSVLVRGLEWDKPLDHPAHYPIFEECERQGLPVIVHLGAGCPALNTLFDGQPEPTEKWKTFYPPRARRLISTMVVQYAFYSLVENGLIDEFPKLHWAFLEGGGSEWVVSAMSAIGRAGTRDCRRYFDEGRIFIGCEPDDDLNWVASKLGREALLAASDMPHTDEASHDDVVRDFEERGDLDSDFLEKLLRRNAMRLFDFERADATKASRTASVA